MPIARVTGLSATSDQSFEDAINPGVNRATSTLRNVESAWIKDMNVMIENGNIAGYKVNMAITFVLEEGASSPVELAIAPVERKDAPATAGAFLVTPERCRIGHLRLVDPTRTRCPLPTLVRP